MLSIMNINCQFCNLTFILNKNVHFNYLKHLRLSHNDTNLNINCIIQGCLYSSNNITNYSRHLSRNHVFNSNN